MPEQRNCKEEPSLRFEEDSSYPSLRFEGDNSYPDCQCCGNCCARINILCVSYEEIDAIRSYMEEHNIEPTDYHKKHCCFMGDDRRCKIWEVRPQTCRLYNCRVPRKDILQRNPSIVVEDDKPLIDMHDAFLEGNISDPRYRKNTGENTDKSQQNE